MTLQMLKTSYLLRFSRVSNFRRRKKSKYLRRVRMRKDFSAQKLFLLFLLKRQVYRPSPLLNCSLQLSFAQQNTVRWDSLISRQFLITFSFLNNRIFTSHRAGMQNSNLMVGQKQIFPHFLAILRAKLICCYHLKGAFIKKTSLKHKILGLSGQI